jgi:hypothetical protein
MWELHGDGELRAFLGAAHVGAQPTARALAALGTGGSANIASLELTDHDLEILDFF